MIGMQFLVVKAAAAAGHVLQRVVLCVFFSSFFTPPPHHMALLLGCTQSPLKHARVKQITGNDTSESSAAEWTDMSSENMRSAISQF